MKERFREIQWAELIQASFCLGERRSDRSPTIVRTLQDYVHKKIQQSLRVPLRVARNEFLLYLFGGKFTNFPHNRQMFWEKFLSIDTNSVVKESLIHVGTRRAAFWSRLGKSRVSHYLLLLSPSRTRHAASLHHIRLMTCFELIKKPLLASRWFLSLFLYAKSIAFVCREQCFRKSRTLLS